MIHWFKQHIKATKFLSCLLVVLISIAILLTAIVPSFAVSTALTPGTWQGSGRASNVLSNGSSSFTMTLTIKVVNQAHKSFSGTLDEDVYSPGNPARVVGLFTSSSIEFFNATTNNGYEYSGTLSSTTINGTWYALDNSSSLTYNGTFTLNKT